MGKHDGNILIHYCITYDWLNSGPETIADLSTLTRVQIDAVEMHLAVTKHEINIQDALKSRKSSGISKGTHYRILAQAKKNIKRSLFTVAIAAQLGLVKPEDVQKLISSVSMV